VGPEPKNILAEKIELRCSESTTVLFRSIRPHQELSISRRSCILLKININFPTQKPFNHTLAYLHIPGKLATAARIELRNTCFKVQHPRERSNII